MAQTGKYSDQVAESLDEPEVVSNGLPPPFPLLVCDVLAVEVFDVVEATVLDDVEDALAATGLDVTIGVVEEIDVAEVVGGTIVRLVMVAVGVAIVVTGSGVVETRIVVIELSCEVVVAMVGGVVDVGASGIVDVVRWIVVLVVCATVTWFKRQACMIRVPCWANPNTEFDDASTLLQLLSTSSSVFLRPDIQLLEQLFPDAKSAAVQPWIVSWYTRLHAWGSTPSWIGCRSFRETADAGDAQRKMIPSSAFRRRLVGGVLRILRFDLVFPFPKQTLAHCVDSQA